MDFIRKYDIELEKEQYYAGELLRGWVVIENAENLRITGVQVYLRGKAHVEWRITRGGERRTVKEDQYFIDDKLIVWGKAAESGDEAATSILERGEHRLPFEFKLPDQCLPCSFESRIGTIRYYLRVIVDIPYASQPQGLKYFTVIGQQIDCINDKYMIPMSASRQLSTKCTFCTCTSGPLSLDACLERTAYCCTEHIRLKCDVTNGTDQDVTLACRLIQNVEYRINKGPLGLNKDITHHVLEYRSPIISPHSVRSFHDLDRDLQVPVMPPTLTDVCRVIEIFYSLRVFVHMEKSGEDLQLEFPFTIATVPYRDAGAQLAEITYEPADDHVEGGIYISPEFQLGQVYDGAADVMEDVILYRPVYVCSAIVPDRAASDLSNGHSPTTKGVASGDRDGQTRSPAPSRAVVTAAGPEHANGCSPVSKVKKIVRQKSSGQAHITTEPISPVHKLVDRDTPLSPAETGLPSSDTRPHTPKNSSPAVALNTVTSSLTETSTVTVTVVVTSHSAVSTTRSTSDTLQSECSGSVSAEHVTLSQQVLVTDSDVTSHVIRDVTTTNNATDDLTSCATVSVIST